MSLDDAEMLAADVARNLGRGDYERLDDGETIDHDRDDLWASLTSASSLCVITLGFIGNVEYSIIMPSLYAYVMSLGGSNLFYGISMGAFSLAKLSFMPALGHWSDKRKMHEPLFFAIGLQILGNFIYAMAPFFGSFWFILVGRVMIGLGAANDTLTSSYIARVTSPKTRTKALTIINCVYILGLVFGPVFNLIVKSIDYETKSGIEFNYLTNPGWLMGILTIIVLAIMVKSFKEPTRIAKFNSPADEAMIMHRSSIESVNGLLDRNTRQQFFKFLKKGFLIHYIITFSSNFILSGLETELPSLTSDSFGWNAVKNSLMYASIGILIACSMFTISMLSNKFQDRQFICFGSVTSALALLYDLIFLHDKKFLLTHFLIGTILLAFSLPMLQSPNFAMYSKRIENAGLGHQIGFYIGIYQSLCGIAKTVAPVVAGYGLSLSDNYFTMSVPFGMSVFVSICCCSTYSTWLKIDDEDREHAPSTPLFGRQLSSSSLGLSNA